MKRRLDAGELFGASDFAKLVARALTDGDPPPPPEIGADDAGIINAPTGDYGAVGRTAADAWLAACIARYAAACKAAAETAETELGDALPDLRSFAPSPVAAKGDAAAGGGAPAATPAPK